MSDKYLVSVCAGREQLNSIRLAKTKGFKVIGLDGQSVPFAIQELDYFIQADVSDVEFCAASLRELNLDIRAIDSFGSEIGLVAAARLRSIFNFNGMTLSQSLALTNKDLMRQKMKELGLDFPAWFVSDNLHDLKSWVENQRGPWIIKPIDSSGSRGVFKINDFGELDHYFSESKKYSRNGQVLIEEFLVGTEYSVETILINGKHYWLTASERVLLHETTAVEIFTCDLNSLIKENFFMSISKFAAGLELKNGPLHTEIILTTDGRVVLIEVAGRCGGSMVSEGIVPAVTGYNLQAAVVDIALGYSPSRPKPKVGSYASLVFLTAKKGVLKKVYLPDDLETNSVKFDISAKIGDELKGAINDGSRLGFVLVTAHSSEQARYLSHAIKSQIKFEVVAP